MVAVAAVYLQHTRVPGWEPNGSEHVDAPPSSVMEFAPFVLASARRKRMRRHQSRLRCPREPSVTGAMQS